MHRNHNVVMTSEVIGVDVSNDSSESLGKIKEIILDKTSGNVAYVALESSGFLGMGSKLYALPWNSIHYDANKDKFITNISKRTLKKSAGFDKAQWPERPDTNLGQ